MPRKTKRAAALVLAVAVLMLTGGCAVLDMLTGRAPVRATPVPEETEAAPSPTVSPSPVPKAHIGLGGQEAATQTQGPEEYTAFSDMVYERPDTDALEQQLRTILEQMKGMEDQSRAQNLWEQAKAIESQYNTALILAMIHNSIDRSDAYWDEEYNCCASGSQRISSRLAQIETAMAESPAGHAMGKAMPNFTTDDPSAGALLRKERDLVSQYSLLMGTLTVPIDGRDVTYAEAGNDRTAWVKWMEQNGEVLGNIYVDLIRTRKQIAALAGYDSYTEYVWQSQEKNMIYTPEMLEDMLGSIRRHMAPVFEEIAETSSPTIPITFTEEETLDYMTKWFESLDPSMADSLRIMTQYGLYDWSSSPNKADTAFTTYIPAYRTPFICSPFDGSFRNVASVLHEFGHFHSYIQNPGADDYSVDTAETAAMTMPLLASGCYDGWFGAEKAGNMREIHLRSLLENFCFQGYLAAFELAAYALDDDELSYDTLCWLSDREWDRYGLSAISASSLNWIVTSHIYESPFYVCSYLTSADAALQIWEQSLEDPALGIRTYNAFLRNAALGENFAQDLRQTGLASPFEEDEIEKQAGILREHILGNGSVDG